MPQSADASILKQQSNSAPILSLLLVLITVGCGSLAFGSDQAPNNYVEYCANPKPAGAENSLCAHALEVGPRNAKHVVVLIPGGDLGAAMLIPTARYLTSTLGDTQVWAVERREQGLADYTRLGSDSRLDYYLKGRYRRETGATAPYTRDWGLGVTINDLKLIVDAARDRGRRTVVLGGHSWGATIALAYAAWDFGGRAGYKDLSGLILVDGGVHDAFAGEGYKFRLTPEDVRTKLEKLKSGDPFTGDLGYYWQLQGPPEAAPLYYQLSARLAVQAPHGASTLQDLLPDSMKAAERLTNAALLGWLLDTHAPAPDLQVHSGHIAESGTLREWVSTGPADITTLASSFASTTPAAVEWYWPRRLTIELEAMDPFVPSEVTRMLDLPITHADEIDVPLYAFETGITHGSVIEAAKWVVSRSKIKKETYSWDHAMAHLDPLYDAPQKNRFLSTVADYLKMLDTAAGR